MPAQRLTDKPVPVARFDVLGEDSASLPNFVRHVGMATEPHQRLWFGDQLPARHMGPPLENLGSMQVHSVGSASLTVDEANQVQLYLDEIELAGRKWGRGPLGSFRLGWAPFTIAAPGRGNRVAARMNSAHCRVESSGSKCQSAAAHRSSQSIIHWLRRR
jgi:hypothetical protein